MPRGCSSATASARRHKILPVDGFTGITGDRSPGGLAKRAKPIANQNSKLAAPYASAHHSWRVRDRWSRYQGHVDYSSRRAEASIFAKKALTGEGLAVMRCRGQVMCSLATGAYDVHLHDH